MTNETTEPKASRAPAVVTPAMRAFEDEYRLQIKQVSTMARAGVLPSAMKDKPDLAVLAMRTCQNFGLPWETHLRYFYVVGGALCVWGDLTRQLVERTGEVAGEERYFQWIDEKGETQRCEEWEVGYRFTHANAPDSLTAIVKVWRRNRENPYLGHFSVGDAKRRTGPRGSLWDQPQYKVSPGFVVKMGWNAEHMAKRRGFPDAYEGIVPKEEAEDTMLPERDAEWHPVDDIGPRSEEPAAPAAPSEAKKAPARAKAKSVVMLTCPACKGAGSVDGDTACPTCNGKGEIPSPVREDELF